jgi:hypothetical protein
MLKGLVLETPASRNRGLVYKGFSAAGLAWNRTCEAADRGFEDSTPATLPQIAWYLPQWRDHTRANPSLEGFVMRGFCSPAAA